MFDDLNDPTPHRVGTEQRSAVAALVRQSRRRRLRIGATAVSAALGVATLLLLPRSSATGTASLILATPPTPPSPTATPTATPTAVPSAPPQAVSPAALCHADQLHAVLRGHPGAASSNHAVIITVRNVSRKTCALRGYPTVTLLDAHDRRIPVKQLNGSGYIFPDPGPHQVLLVPGSEGSCTVNWANDQNPPQYAPSVTMLLQLGSRGTLRIPVVMELEPAAPTLSITAFMEGQPTSP